MKIDVELDLDELYILTLALQNDPLRPTLTEDNQTQIETYLRLVSKIQIARKSIENGVGKRF